MDSIVACPVCTLFLRPGMSLEDHLDSHPKDKVIKALAFMSLASSEIPRKEEPQQQQQQQQQLHTALSAMGAPATSNSVTIVAHRGSPALQGPFDVPVSDAASASPSTSTLSILPRYTNERYSGPPPPYNSHRGQQQGQEQQQQQQQQQLQQQSTQQPQPQRRPQQQQQQQQQQQLVQQLQPPPPAPPPPLPPSPQQAATSAPGNVSANRKTKYIIEPDPNETASGQSCVPTMFRGIIGACADATPQAIPGRAVTIQRIDKNDGQTPEEVRIKREAGLVLEEPTAAPDKSTSGMVASSTSTGLPIPLRGQPDSETVAPRSEPPLPLILSSSSSTDASTPGRKRPEDIRVLSDVKVTAPLSECYKTVILNFSAQKLPLSIGDKTAIIEPARRVLTSTRRLPAKPSSDVNAKGELKELVFSPESGMPPIDFGQVHAIEIRNDEEEPAGQGEREAPEEHDADAETDGGENVKRGKRRVETRRAGSKRMRMAAAKDCYTGNLSLNVKAVSVTPAAGHGDKQPSVAHASSSSSSSANAMVTSVIRKTPHPARSPSKMEISPPHATPEAGGSTTVNPIATSSNMSLGSSSMEETNVTDEINAIAASLKRPVPPPTARGTTAVTASPFSIGSSGGSSYVELPADANGGLEIAASSALSLQSVREMTPPAARGTTAVTASPISIGSSTGSSCVEVPVDANERLGNAASSALSLQPLPPPAARGTTAVTASPFPIGASTGSGSVEVPVDANERLGNAASSALSLESVREMEPQRWPIYRPRRMRLTAHLSTSRPAPGPYPIRMGARTTVSQRSAADYAARELMLASVRSGNIPGCFAPGSFALQLAQLAPAIDAGDYNISYVDDDGVTRYEKLTNSQSEITDFIRREGIPLEHVTIVEPSANNRESGSRSSALAEAAAEMLFIDDLLTEPEHMLDLPMVYLPGSVQQVDERNGGVSQEVVTEEVVHEEREEEEEGEETDEGEEEDEEAAAEAEAEEEEEEEEEDEEEYDDEDDEDEEDADDEYGEEEEDERDGDEDRPDDGAPDANGRDGQQEPPNRQHQNDERQQDPDRQQQDPRGQSKRQPDKEDDRFMIQEDAELPAQNPDVHGLAIEPVGARRMKQQPGQVHGQVGVLPHASLECFEMVAEVEVQSEEIARKPIADVGMQTSPGDVRDFFEAGPSSQKSRTRVFSDASFKRQPGQQQLHADQKDYLEAGPSTRAVPPPRCPYDSVATYTSQMLATYQLRADHQIGHRFPLLFEEYDDRISWLRETYPHHVYASRLPGAGQESTPPVNETDGGADEKRALFRRSEGHAREHDNSSSSDVEVPLCDSKALDIIPGTSDTSVSVDGDDADGGTVGAGSVGAGGEGGAACGGELAHSKSSTNRHSSVSSIATSNSLERAPSAESLNIRTDEKMPAKGEISEQESNGDMDMMSWKPCAGNDSFPVYPISYDLSTAQESWNLSTRNPGNHNALSTGPQSYHRRYFATLDAYRKSLGTRYPPPFPFSSSSQTLLSSYASRGNPGPDECKDEDDNGLADAHEEGEEERERSGSMKRLIPKIRFHEMDTANTGARPQQHPPLHSTSNAPFAHGLLEEKYSPEATMTSHFVGFVSAPHAASTEVPAGPTPMAVMRPMNEPKPSGSGTARTYRCTKCLKTFTSIKQRREHQQQEHPGDGQQEQKHQPQHQFEPQLRTACEFGDELKEGILKEKPAPARILPVVMNYDWLRMEIQRKYELVSHQSDKLAEMSVPTVVHRRSFVCPICQVEFERFNQFNTHLSVHPAECLTCGRYFKQWRNFTLHLKRHLGIKEHGCRVCGKHFVIKQKLIEHMRVHTGHAPIRCKLCNRHFKRFSNLAQHSNRYHLNKVVVKHDYVCSQCGDVFPTRAKMEWHKETHDQKPKPCPYCREKFIHQNSLTRHIRLSHTDKYALLENKTEPCTVCQQPYTKASMRRHMETHAEGRLVFSCSICNKHFTTNWNLKQHKWTHANPTMKPFQCTICPTGFVRESDYLTHVNSHRSIRPYTCNHCGRQFIRKYNWLRHSREHETDKGHNCEVCGRQFHRKYYLTEHKRIHTGERPYACNICGKTSSTKTNHNKHVRIHHARDPLTAEG